MILWLTGRKEISAGIKSLLLLTLKTQGINSTDITFSSLHMKVPSLGEYKKRAMPQAHYMEAAKLALMNDYCKILGDSLSLIVVNDEATLRTITGKAYTLAQVRGSVYDFNGIPVLVMDDFKLMHAQVHGAFVYGFDLKKLVRYAKKQVQQEPTFNYYLARSVDDVRWHCERAKRATLIGEDIETRAGVIASVAFTYDAGDILCTFTVPFIDPDREDGAYWSETNEVAVRMLLADLNACDVPKVFQNGMYDCAYLIEEGMPPVNYLYDTVNMMHALWCEAPKKLQHIASYFIDCYQYWKDENKGAKEDGFGRSRNDLLRFWRYNGLDTYYTWLGCFYLVQRIVRVPWAMRNYDTTFSLATGPNLAASLRGLKGDQDRHARMMQGKIAQSNAGKQDLRDLTGEPDFNIRSSIDVPWFLYDILGAKPTRLQTRKNSKYGLRSADENVLKLIKEQGNVIINNFIDRLIEAREPATVLSKFGNTGKLWRRGRFLTWLGTTGTVTSRFNSTKSQFWCGSNAQNIEDELKQFYVADPEFVLVEIDYSASDDRFIAYESQDPDKIETVEGDKDIHCKHASVFFGKPYDEIYRAYKAKETWVIHSTKGIRQITKKITHGRNYMEGASTMYNVIGRDVMVAAAEALGHQKAMKYIDKELIGVIDTLIDKYDHPLRGLYKRIRLWQSEVVKAAIRNDGIASFAYGFTRKFFGNLSNDNKAQRELISCFGQSGTAGNINRTLKKVWYSGMDDGKKCIYLLQTHDSLMFAMHKTVFSSVIPQIVSIMEEPTVIHGRTMRVPAQPKIGLTWGDAIENVDADGKKKVTACMREWKPEMTYENILAHEAIYRAEFDKKYPKDESFELAKQMIDEIAASQQEDDEDDDDEIEIPEFEPVDDGQSGVKLEHASV